MPPLWHAADTSVRLETRLSASVSPLLPGAGLSDLRVDGSPLAGLQPLAIQLAAMQLPTAGAALLPSNVDYYVRGGDLIITYAEWPQPAMRAQFYWRAASHATRGAIAAVEWVGSVQTSLLDSCPQLATRSDVPASEAFQLDDLNRATFSALAFSKESNPSRPHCYVFRLAASPYSYAEMVMPADALESRWQADAEGRGQLLHLLFADRLEKGVILRARILGVVLERAGDLDAAARHYAAFLAEDLPLTT